MSADLSRVRFDPLRDHSGIGIQQGRLWLDADFNEQVAITDRRQRAQVVDLAPTPSIVSRLTPGAFELKLSGGNLTIGAGRMYVDGLLAENHGATTGFDPVLGEPNGTGAVAYGKQPYWPDPDKLPDGGPHLAYLDVWERELSYLNAPHLVESAVGVDTTTRTQVVWQVRLLPKVDAGTTCDSKIKAWDALVAPSAVRLTTGTVEVAPVDELCDLPPGAGYRGPENQLYRVELHTPTQFKWSRDNASVASTVAEVGNGGTWLRLHTLGRDEVLRIKENDWVEITDDAWELARKPGKEAGELRQVKVDDATATITFSPALPPELQSLDHHLRVRKWDSGLVSIPSDGSPVTLERGVTVAFTTLPGGTGRAGDYWVFYARASAPTADESLEKLVEAAPRGTHHHYVRLAVLNMPGTASDCRPGWPAPTGKDCGCEICVAPDQHNDGTFTLQEAVQALAKAGGGTLSLCPGKYQLKQPLDISRARSLTIRGHGPASRLVPAGTAAIAVSLSKDITLRDFAIAGTGAGAGIVFTAANQDCRLERLSLSEPKNEAVGLSGAQLRTAIAGCTITSAVGVQAATGKAGLLTTGLSIVDNTFFCGTRAIDLGVDRDRVVQHSGVTTIAGNTVTGCADTAIVATGLVPQDVPELDGALDVIANTIEAIGSGIVVGGRARVADNTLTAARRMADANGIALTASPPDTPDGVSVVLANKVSGFGGTGIAVTAQLRALTVKQNVVRATGSGIVVQPKAPGAIVAVDDNQVLDLRQPSGSGDLTIVHAVLDIAAVRGATLTRPSARRAFDFEQPATLSAGTATRSARTVAAAGRATRLPSETVSGAIGRASVPVGRAAESAADPRAVARPEAAAAPDASASPASELGRISSTVGRLIPNAGTISQAGRAGFTAGVIVVGAGTATISRNAIDGVGALEPDATQTWPCIGISVLSCREVRIFGNSLSRIGHPQNPANATGMMLMNWQTTLSIVDNSVWPDDGSTGATRSAWSALMVVAASAFNLGGIRTAATSDRIWTFAGDYAYLQPAVSGHIEMTGNTMQGGGELVAVNIMTGGESVISDNRFIQPGGGEQVAVRLKAGLASVRGNRVKGGKPSISMQVEVQAACVLGNITSGGIRINATAVEDTHQPWSALNPIAG